MCLAQEIYYQPCNHRYRQPLEHCGPMAEHLQSTANAPELECANHHTIILEAVDFCNHCTKQMKVTATMALVALKEMNIAGTDETGGKAINEKTKERPKEKVKVKEGGSRKHADHLALPVWNTKKIQKNRERARSVGPNDKHGRAKTARRKRRRNSLAIIGGQPDDIKAEILVPWYTVLIDSTATKTISAGSHGRNVESLHRKWQPRVCSAPIHLTQYFLSGYPNAELCASCAA
ncbi:hypothetical protein V501_09061 [Pseudogymnoascus sp. VKM F-4519 (FW-2642)]|nr:hypothetical protein V501_09061 [Pseudogymnoascus sp. VKM F-4519 (FW-2642)]